MSIPVLKRVTESMFRGHNVYLAEPVDIRVHQFIRQNKSEIIWQTVLFSLYGLLGLVQTYAELGFSFYTVSGVLIVTVIECLLINLNANWLSVSYPVHKHPVQYTVGLFSLLMGYLIIRYFTAYPDFVDVLNTYHGEQRPPSVLFFVFLQMINFAVTILVSWAIRLYKNNVLSERKARQLESEVNEARLAMLKHQINPHFLYNTLSYMYSQARPLSDNLSKSILILADMMRYSLDKTSDNQNASIAKEVDYIENYIQIYRLRFGSAFFVNFQIEGVIDQRKIVPLILITFVENAFKHGKLNDSNQPIAIKLTVNKRSLIFWVKNYKQPGIKDSTSGIGLENTRNRLQLAYPQQHTLTITNETSFFEVLLIINLPSV